MIAGEALEEAPQTPALSLSILPEAERQQVIESLQCDARLSAGAAGP